MPLPDALLADRYRLLKCIGCGAAGKVWRAHDVRLDRIVAVKTVHIVNDADAPGSVARFRREARASAAISSPFVVAVYDAGRDGDFAFLVMELLSGPSLKDLLGERGPLPLKEGLRITSDVARGLAAAHATGFVHRDLKPGNVVFGDAVPKIVDFGIARLADPGEATMTSASMVAGTAAYMSPEQAMGKVVGPASDVYALGCLIYTVFTGEPPFTYDSAVAQATAQVREEPPPLGERRPELPAALVALAAQLLDKDADARPSAAEVADALDALAERPRSAASTDLMRAQERRPAARKQPRVAAVRAGATQAPRRTGSKPAGRHAGPWPWIATSVLALVAAVMATQAWQAQRPVETSPSPVVPIASTGMPTATPTLALPTLTQTPHPSGDDSSRSSDETPRQKRSASPSQRPSSVESSTPSQTPRESVTPSAAPTAASANTSATPTGTPSATPTS